MILLWGLPGDSPLAAVHRALSSSLNLPVAGIDLRRTPDGRWYCFEVNPSPGFTYFQKETHQAIDETIARLLISEMSIECMKENIVL